MTEYKKVDIWLMNGDHLSFIDVTDFHYGDNEISLGEEDSRWCVRIENVSHVRVVRK